MRHLEPVRWESFCHQSAATNEGVDVMYPSLQVDSAMTSLGRDRVALVVLGTPSDRPMCEMDSWPFILDRVVLKGFRFAQHGVSLFRMVN